MHRLLIPVAGALLALGVLAAPAAAAGPAGAGAAVVAQTAPRPPTPTTPTPGRGQGAVIFEPGPIGRQPSQSVLIILALTVLSVAPALLMLLTSFTRIVIVLSITRNAIGLQAVPPNQVVVGLALFLTLFIMSPTLTAMNRDGLQPVLKGQKSPTEGYRAASAPLKQFMLKQTRKEELELFIKSSGKPRPKDPASVEMATLAPAFILSELRTAFIIGFVVFIPFLIIDILISSTLMSMGLMMLPPVLISLPFKLLLFVMVDGWGLVVRSLISSFR